MRALLAAALTCAVLAGTAPALAQQQPVSPQVGQLVVNDTLHPPGDDAAWVPVQLPDSWRRSRPLQPSAVAWYRIEFEVAHLDPGQSYAVYLPYLYAGGALYLNGIPVERIRESDERHVVRWERPHLVVVPAGQVLQGRNVLHVRRPMASLRFPRVTFGTRDAVLPLYERRFLWASTMPQVTTVACTLMSLFLLFIWWRRRHEAIYGLLGAAALLWGVRTLTFVIERIPADLYVLWRAAYHGATGGFVVMMALFAMRFSGMRKVWLERALVAYWLIGPLAMVMGEKMDATVGRIWSAGLIPVALMLVAFVARAAATQRTWQAFALLAAITLAVLTGVHDHLVSWGEPLMAAVVPQWIGHRIFLLHHAANLLLLTTVVILVVRFVQTLDAVEDLNESLEARVAARERELESTYDALTLMERERATEEERDRIMQDMHDGLGSQLLTSLSRVERGALAQKELADVLRTCIAEMRLALDALVPADEDFSGALGNFRYRWEQQLSANGIGSQWEMGGLDSARGVPAHQRLQVLRILQEALTNVIKHAQATAVRVRVSDGERGITFEICDDGRGIDANPQVGGRGLNNMHTRARRMGAEFDVGHNLPRGTRVVLRLARSAEAGALQARQYRTRGTPQ